MGCMISSSRCRPKGSERQGEGESDEIQRGLLKFPRQLLCLKRNIPLYEAIAVTASESARLKSITGKADL